MEGQYLDDNWDYYEYGADEMKEAQLMKGI